MTWRNNLSSVNHPVLGVIIVFVIALFLSFLLFTLGYWVIHIILQFFFNITLPFSWGYSLGAWLILCVITTLTGGIKIKMN